MNSTSYKGEKKYYNQSRKINSQIRKKRRKRKIITFYIFLIINILFISVFFVLHNFFQITDIEIKGSKKYSYDQIKKCANLEVGQNIFKHRSNLIVNRLKQKLTYVDDAKVQKNLPNKIQISVIDSVPKYLFVLRDKYFVVSKNFKILENKEEKFSDKTQFRELIKINGLSISDEDIGKFITQNNNKFILLKQLTNALNINKFYGIKQINLTNRNDIKIKYQNRMIILLGNIEQIDYKIKFAKHIIDKNIDKNEVGTIDETDVLTSSKVYFIPHVDNVISSRDIKKVQYNENTEENSSSQTEDSNNFEENRNL